MSSQSIVNWTGNQKIYDSLLPNPYPYPAFPNPLAQVLLAGDDAGNQDIENLRQLNTSIITQQDALLGSSLSIGGLPNTPLAGGFLQIQGATAKGSLLVGDGTYTTELPVPAPALPNGSVLILDDSQPLGVRWGGESGDINSITPGNNIDITGPTANPIVAFQSPTTSDIVLGVGTKIEAKDNYSTPNFAMTLDATGFNDTYTNGAVENKEDIEVNATSVVQLLSATDGSSYLNTDTTNVNNTGIVENLTATNLSTTNIGNVSLTCYSNSAGLACGCSAPTTPPFPEVSATAGLSATTTNAQLSLSQSAPFATTYSTILDINGINQNNSAGAGFNLQTAQDLTLTCPSANKIIVPNGNNIDLSTTGGGGQTFTTEYRKDGYTAQDFLAANYSGQVQAFTTGGSSQMFLSSSNLASASNQYLRLESTFGGDMNIEHNATAGRNLAITSTNNLTIGADNIDLSATGRLIVPSLASADRLDYNPALGQLSMTTDNAGGSANPPILFLQNTNATGSVYTEVYKNKPTAGAIGDVVHLQSVFGKDSANTKQEYTRITHQIRDPTAGSEDAQLDFGCVRGGSINTFLSLNGIENEVNCLKNLDMGGNTITTNAGNLTLTCPTAGGSIALTSASNVDITATGDNLTTISGANTTISTTGVGSQIEFKPETTAGQIVFTGAALQSNTSSGNSGEHLVIYLNGVKYHIALQTP